MKSDAGYGIEGSSTSGDGVYGQSGTGYTGLFFGAVYVTGTLQVAGQIFAGTKNFLIDHPLDPANKYLYHASVESSEMMNIYTGNVTTDAQGDAAVELPDWFEVLNKDFRYQLTVIGQFAQAIVSRKISGHQFSSSWRLGRKAPGRRTPCRWNLLRARGRPSWRFQGAEEKANRPQTTARL